MKRTAAAKKVPVNASIAAAADRKSPLPSEREAAEMMWVYYRNNMAQLISDIKEYRATILAKLVGGMAVEQVFALFAKPAEPAKALQRAA